MTSWGPLMSCPLEMSSFCNLQPYDLSSSRNLGGMVDCCREISFWNIIIYIYIYTESSPAPKSLFWSEKTLAGIPFTSLFCLAWSKLQAPRCLYFHINQDTCTRRSSPAVLKTCGKRSFNVRSGCGSMCLPEFIEFFLECISWPTDTFNENRFILSTGPFLQSSLCTGILGHVYKVSYRG